MFLSLCLPRPLKRSLPVIPIWIKWREHFSHAVWYAVMWLLFTFTAVIKKELSLVLWYMLHHHGIVNVLTAPLLTGQYVYESLFTYCLMRSEKKSMIKFGCGQYLKKKWKKKMKSLDDHMIISYIGAFSAETGSLRGKNSHTQSRKHLIGQKSA